MRRLVSIVVVLGVLGAAFVMGGASDRKEGRTYRLVFDNAFGLVEGGDFRVGGVRAGQTKEFEIKKERGKPPKAVVVAEVREEGFDDFREDATCEVRPQSLIGEYYVDCQTGSSKRKLPTDGSGTVPVEQTSSTIPTDLVNNILRRPYRERFRMILNELGTGLAGRPRDLQEVLKRSHPGLRETSRVLRILGGQNRIIENFVRDSDTVIGELNGNRREVARWVDEAGDAAEISASRREALRRSFERLPTFLGELQPTMARLEDLIDEQSPLLTDLRRAAPSLNVFFSRLGPFSRASRPALRSLGEASEVGTRAFREGAQEVNELVELAPKAQPTFKPLRQFLQTMDDRRRALENDPRAKNGGPPAPDPTHISGAGGFTGLEAIWNYPFWQGLSVNGYDDIGHLLRVSITADPFCSELHNEIDLGNPGERADFERCSQWLGPNLPGITSPDFTDSPNTLARLRQESSRPAGRVGERRSAGQPDAAPLPGQPDVSRPQIVLPPKARELLDRLPARQRRRLPGLGELQNRLPGGGGADDRTTGHLLDFLLRP